MNSRFIGNNVFGISSTRKSKCSPQKGHKERNFGSSSTLVAERKAFLPMNDLNASGGSSEQPTFTCLSCLVGFLTAEGQRNHYRSDHHRYNMKRRVASLPPVTLDIFNQKVLERRQETAIIASSRGSTCETCEKVYTTENAYMSHLKSRKHKENELKVLKTRKSDHTQTYPDIGVRASSPENQPKLSSRLQTAPSLVVSTEATEDEINQTIDEKIAAARSRLSVNNCLFCPHQTPDLEENLTHMAKNHSFFIPDAEYLIDLTGLITYLGEKIAVGNVCIYCNTRSREFRTLHAVRKHMLDKSHCKIAYDTEQEKLEISDYYDFTASYPESKPSYTKHKVKAKDSADDDEWEDVSEGEESGSGDETVDDSDAGGSDSTSDASIAPKDTITFGDSPYELVLPSGARIGHRSMKRYYAQNFLPNRLAIEDPKSGAFLVRRLLADKNLALVPRKGGYGAFGVGNELIKARNRGEAREAGRHVREFRDQKRREDFKTRVGFIANSQKHYRDPLLQ